MIAYLARHAAALLDRVLGEPCAVTGERTFPKDRGWHEADEHALDGPCAPRCPDGRPPACVTERSLCTFPRCATEPPGKFNA